MTDPVVKLKALLDAQEQMATAAAVGLPWHSEDGCIYGNQVGELWHREGDHNTPMEIMAAHVALWDPSHVIRDINAKRAVIAEYERWSAIAKKDDDSQTALYAVGVWKAIEILAGESAE